MKRGAAHGSRNPCNYELQKDHKQDLSVPIQLDGLVKEKDVAFGCCSGLELVSDVLVMNVIRVRLITNWTWSFYDGPQSYDEVLQEDRRPILSQKEEKLKAWLENEVGKQTFLGSLAPRFITPFRNQNEW